MRELSPYREAADKASGISREERGRIIDEMMCAHNVRAKANEARRLSLLPPTTHLALGAVALFGVLYAVAFEPRLVVTFAVMTTIGLGAGLFVAWSARPPPT